MEGGGIGLNVLNFDISVILFQWTFLNITKANLLPESGASSMGRRQVYPISIDIN